MNITPGIWQYGYASIEGDYGTEFLVVGIDGNPWIPIALVSPEQGADSVDITNAAAIAEIPNMLKILQLLKAHKNYPELLRLTSEVLDRIKSAT